MDNKLGDAGDGDAAAPQHSGDDPVAVCPGRRQRPPLPREQPATHGMQHPKKHIPHLLNGVPMNFEFVDEHRAAWPIGVTCAALGFSASSYYACRARTESRRAAANRALLDDIRLIHAESSGTYSSPRVCAVLCGNGRRISR